MALASDKSSVNSSPQKLARFLDAAIVLLLVLAFRSALIWMVQYFSEPTSYEYLILLLIIVVVSGLWLKQRLKEQKTNISFQASVLPLAALLAALSLDLVNTLFLHFNIVSPIAFFLAAYGVTGFYLPRRLWQRGLFLLLLAMSTLPFILHIQTFLGFPLRLFTAKVVSSIMGILGMASITDSTIILTENNATSIDLPCSGVNSIYTGGIFLLTVAFLQNLRLSWKALLAAFGFFAVLILSNVWRVFSLVYIYDVLDMNAFGNAIHVFLGVLGFTVACILLWFVASRYLPKRKIDGTPTKEDKSSQSIASKLKIKKTSLIIILVIFLVVDFITVWQVNLEPEVLNESITVELEVNGVDLQQQEFTEIEQDFFVNRDVEFSRKYIGQTKEGLSFSLLLITSNSWRTHHMPEVCLRGLGHKIGDEEIFQIDDLRLRQLSLNNDQDTVLYWFTNQDGQTLNDYSERAWAGIKDPQQNWTLVEIGFGQALDLDQPEVSALVEEINTAVDAIDL